MVYATLRNPILPRQGGFVTDTISFSEEQGIATLTFDNPSRRNALGAAELDAIEREFAGAVKKHATDLAAARARAFQRAVRQTVEPDVPVV